MIFPALLCATALLGRPQEPTDALLITQVEETTGEAYREALQLAFERFMQRVDAYELDAAAALISTMHERDRASWSAESYSMLLGRMGHFDEARKVLDEQLLITEQGPQYRALLKTRALSELGAGHVHRARRELGAALLHGSSDASVVLARLAITADHRERARCLSRAQLALEPAPAWALRSWGLSMLPPSGDSPPR